MLKFTFKALLALIVLLGSNAVMGQSFVPSNATGSTFLGHEFSGTFGSVGGSNQWIGLGESFPSSVNAYGLRTQWGNDVYTFSIEQTGSVKETLLQWGGSTNNDKLRFQHLTTSGSSTPAKLDVLTLTNEGRVGINSINPYFYSALHVVYDANSSVVGSNSAAYSIRAEAKNGRYTNTAIYGSADGSGTCCGGNTGVYGYAFNRSSSYGVYGYATFSSGTKYGVYGSAFGGGTNYGVYGRASNGSTNYAGYFNGQTYVGGTIFGSDRKLKRNVQRLEGAVDVLQKIDLYTYEYRQDIQGMNFPEGRRYGVMAQDIEKVMPALVNDIVQPEEKDEQGRVIYQGQTFKGVDYVALIPLTMAAVKEQQGIINSQRAQIQQLQKQLEEVQARLDQLAAGTAQPQDPLGKEARLLQNTPNPFTEVTEVRFNLPAGTPKAMLYIYNMQGSQVGAYEVSAQGQGSVRIEGNTLQAGMYMYTLIANGREIDTKRMILTR